MRAERGGVLPSALLEERAVISPRRTHASFAALCALLAVACANGSEEAERAGAGAGASAASVDATFIGSIAGTEARIALVRGERSLVAYVCGKGTTLATHTRWFHADLRATSAGDTLSVVSADWTLRVEPAGDGLQGEVQGPGGEIETWTAPRAPDAGETEVGLYDAAQDGCRSGVIVWQAQPGAACDAQGSYCDGAGSRSQITPVLCEAGRPLDVRATRGGQEIALTFARVVVP